MRVKNDIKIRKERGKKNRLNSLVSKHKDWILIKTKNQPQSKLSKEYDN